jgi:hypothetical protein
MLALTFENVLAVLAMVGEYFGTVYDSSNRFQSQGKERWHPYLYLKVQTLTTNWTEVHGGPSLVAGVGARPKIRNTSFGQRRKHTGKKRNSNPKVEKIQLKPVTLHCQMAVQNNINCHFALQSKSAK